MANFTVINNYTFPSPSIRQNSGQTMVFTPTSFNTTNVLGTICSTTIQFPSPTYVIATQSNGCLPVSDQRSGLYTNSSNVCTRLKGDWQHDVPSTMPWMNQYFSNTVTFTGDTISTGSSGSTSTVNGRCLKRKGEMRNVPVDSKVFINEDRVAEGMRNLQLSAVGNNNSSVAADRNQAWFTATPQSQSTTGEYPQTEVEMCDEDVVEGGVCEEEGAETSGPRLHLCEQLRARLANRDILQSLITTELTKSNKQLVLWTPPGGHITLMLRSESGSLCGQSERSQALDLIDMGSTVVSSNSGVSSTQKSAMSVAVEDSTTSFSTPARPHPGTLQDSTLTVPTRSSPFAAQNISTPASPQNHSSQSVLQGSDLLSPWLQMHNNNNVISVRHNGGGVLAHSSARSLLVEEDGISVNPELAYLGVDHMEDEDLNLVSSTQKSAMSVAVEDSTTSFSTPARSHPGTLQDSTLTVPTRSSPFAAQNISTPASPQNHSSQSVLQGSDLLSPWLQMHNNNNGISVRHNGGGVLAHSSARSLLVEEEGISVNPELAYLGVDHMEDEDLNL